MQEPVNLRTDKWSAYHLRIKKKNEWKGARSQRQAEVNQHTHGGDSSLERKEMLRLFEKIIARDFLDLMKMI